MNGYTQINVKKADMLYRRPDNQNKSHSSMTSKVHDTHLMLLVFLDLKKKGFFTDKILPNEWVDPYLKEFTFSMLKINFKWTRFYVLLINAHSLIYNQIDCVEFFFETYIKAVILL